MKYSILKFKTNEKYTMRDLEKFRGFLAEKYKENIFFHNHLGEGYNYSYPKLQYKLIKNTLSVMCIEDEELLKINNKLFEEIEFLDIGGKIVSNIEKELKILDKEIGYSKDEIFEYKFVTPYLPLNKENFRLYINGKYNLERAIANNILEVLKGLKIWLEKDQKIVVESNLEFQNRKLKDVNMMAFNGTFYTNIKFPSYFSLGKRKSIGYGTFIDAKKLKKFF